MNVNFDTTKFNEAIDIVEELNKKFTTKNRNEILLITKNLKETLTTVNNSNSKIMIKGALKNFRRNIKWLYDSDDSLKELKNIVECNIKGV